MAERAYHPRQRLNVKSRVTVAPVKPGGTPVPAQIVSYPAGRPRKDGHRPVIVEIGGVQVLTDTATFVHTIWACPTVARGVPKTKRKPKAPPEPDDGDL